MVEEWVLNSVRRKLNDWEKDNGKNRDSGAAESGALPMPMGKIGKSAMSSRRLRKSSSPRAATVIPTKAGIQRIPNSAGRMSVA